MVSLLSLWTSVKPFTPLRFCKASDAVIDSFPSSRSVSLLSDSLVHLSSSDFWLAFVVLFSRDPCLQSMHSGSTTDSEETASVSTSTNSSLFDSSMVSGFWDYIFPCCFKEIIAFSRGNRSCLGSCFSFSEPSNKVRKE